MKENMTGKSMKNFDFISIIGQGAWAIVYKAYDNSSQRQVAIKAIPKQKVRQTKKLQELIKTQIAVLRACKNQNVIGFVDTFTSEKSIFIATEFCNGGDLQQYLYKKKALSQDQAVTFLKQIINGFKGLHEVNAMHRDFKLANILLHNGVCKIADLGFAKTMVNTLTHTILGTSLTMAPQLLKEKAYGIQADIWSIGVVFYQMIYGDYPFKGKTDQAILQQINTKRPNYSKVRISQQCIDFIDKCLTPEPQKRIKWPQVYAHPLLTRKNDFKYNLGKGQINKNKGFYEKPKPNVQVQPQMNISIEDVNFEKVADQKMIKNFDIKKKQMELKQKMQLSFAQYANKYIMRRNDLIFAMRFISPEILKLSHIKANHELSMYVLLKKTYMDIKQYLESIKQGKNIFEISHFWSEFKKSIQYQNIMEQVQSDLDMTYSNCLGYQIDIDFDSCSSQIRAQAELDKIGSSNFKNFVKETLREYWFLLAQNLDMVTGKQKQALLSVLEALDYYNSDKKTSAQQYVHQIAHTDFAKSEEKIKLKLKQVYENL